jgi:hypothetical protein
MAFINHSSLDDANPSDAAIIAKWAYGKMADSDLPDGWEPIEFENTDQYSFDRKFFYNGTNGYAGAALYNINTHEIVIAHRGTEMPTVADLGTDFLLPLLGNNLQSNSAEAFYQLVATKLTTDPTYANATITAHVGDSLGGNLALYMASKHPDTESAIAFEAPGVATSVDLNANHDNLITFLNPYDFVGSSCPHVGNVKFLNVADPGYQNASVVSNDPNANLTNQNFLAAAFQTLVESVTGIQVDAHNINNFIGTNTYSNTPPTECTYQNFEDFRQLQLTGKVTMDTLLANTSITNIDIVTYDDLKNDTNGNYKYMLGINGQQEYNLFFIKFNSQNIFGDLLQIVGNAVGMTLNLFINEPENNEAKTVESKLSVTTSATGQNQLNLTASTTQDMQTVLENLNIDATNADKINSITVENNTYFIQSGDTVWNFADERGFNIDEILATNSWLTEQHRVSEDKSFILIKPGEKLHISFIPEKIKVDSYDKIIITKLDNAPPNTELEYFYYIQGGPNDYSLIAVPHIYVPEEDSYYDMFNFDFLGIDYEEKWVTINNEAYIDYTDIFDDYGEYAYDCFDTIYSLYEATFNGSDLEWNSKELLIAPNENLIISSSGQITGKSGKNIFFIVNSNIGYSTICNISNFNPSEDIIYLEEENQNIGISFEENNTVLMVNNQNIVLEGIEPNQLMIDNFVSYDGGKINFAPIVNLTEKETNEDQEIIIDVLAQASDMEGDALAIDSVTNAQNGTVVIEKGKIKYTPNANYNGLDTFTYTINDGKGGTMTKTMTLTINAINDTPTITNISQTADEDHTVTFTAANFTSQFSDIDGDSLRKIKIASLPSNGRLKLRGSAVTQNQEIAVTNLAHLSFAPDADWNGDTSFDWQGFDGTAYSGNTAQVNITVNPVNDAPTATSTSASTNEGEEVTIDVLSISNASDIDGDALNIDSITNPVYGVAEILNNQVAYTPDDAFFGEDELEYTVSDGNGGYVTETLNLDVLIDDITYDTSNSATFNGTSGNDNLLGGRGNDILKGKGGDDTYIFRRGDGKDTIDNYQKKWKWQSYEDDKIRFAQGISAQDLDFVKSGKNLIIYLNQDNASTSDKITVKNWFKGTSFWQKAILKKESRKLASIDFVDGSSLSKSDIESALLYKRGTNRDNTLNGSSKANRISGMGGDDRINSGKGNDIVNGGRGNDYIYDTSGNDTFMFHDGDGVDTIDNRGKTSHRNDKVQFGRNVDMNDIYFYFNSNDLYINYGDDDRIRIKNQKWSSRKIEKVELDNGYYVTDNDINRIIQDMSAFATDQGIDLTNRDEVRANSELMNVVTSAWHE